MKSQTTQGANHAPITKSVCESINQSIHQKKSLDHLGSHSVIQSITWWIRISFICLRNYFNNQLVDKLDEKSLYQSIHYEAEDQLLDQPVKTLRSWDVILSFAFPRMSLLIKGLWKNVFRQSSAGIFGIARKSVLSTKVLNYWKDAPSSTISQ